jgi:hypothetical protein
MDTNDYKAEDFGVDNFIARMRLKRVTKWLIAAGYLPWLVSTPI